MAVPTTSGRCAAPVLLRPGRALALAALVACSGVTPAGRTATAPPREPAATGTAAPKPRVAVAVDVAVLERGIFEEMNRARRDPAGYAALIESLLSYYDGNVLREPGRPAVRTEEGVRAAREAVRVLRAMRPVGALAPSEGMSLAARDHVRDQAAGRTGHQGSDGSTFADRVNRYGQWRTSVSENIAYGPRTPRDVVMGLIVDDGVADRAHRRNMFDPVVSVAGVACGPHAEYRWMCVIEYAGGYVEGRGRRERSARP
jgi:uncharacterized protein YkwD